MDALDTEIYKTPGLERKALRLGIATLKETHEIPFDLEAQDVLWGPEGPPYC